MDLSWTIDNRDGVTLVACRLRNQSEIGRRVRLENELDGPVLPPRSHGVPLPGWDADGITLRVAPGESAAVGYAVPAPAGDPPASIVSDEPARVDSTPPIDVGDRGGETLASTASAATDAVRTLGAYRPPGEVITTVERPSSGTESPSSLGSLDPVLDEAPTNSGPVASSMDAVSREPDTPSASPADPVAVDAWLDAVERRVARAERLDGAALPTATEAVAMAGGIDAVQELDEKVDEDAARLQAVARRASALAERAVAVEVPLDPLGRLA